VQYWYMLWQHDGYC